MDPESANNPPNPDSPKPVESFPNGSQNGQANKKEGAQETARELQAQSHAGANPETVLRKLAIAKTPQELEDLFNSPSAPDHVTAPAEKLPTEGEQSAQQTLTEPKDAVGPSQEQRNDVTPLGEQLAQEAGQYLQKENPDSDEQVPRELTLEDRQKHAQFIEAQLKEKGIYDSLSEDDRTKIIDYLAANPDGVVNVSLTERKPLKTIYSEVNAQIIVGTQRLEELTEKGDQLTDEEKAELRSNVTVLQALKLLAEVALSALINAGRAALQK